MGMSAWWFLPISAGSMSMCITRACGANPCASPVERFAKRVPTASTRSLSCIASFAAGSPYIPSIPRLSGLSSGKPPLPVSVVATGICIDSASCVSSAVAPEAMTPPPAYMTGRFAFSIARAACFTCLLLPLYVGLYDWSLTSAG